MKTPNESYVILGMGLIGESLYKNLSNCTNDYRLFAFDHARVDVTCRDQVRPILEYINPTTVILCAGMFDADECESNKPLARTLNTLAPSLVAEECKRIHAKLVYFSSSMVYDNRRKTASSERTKIGPINTLGKTKLDGENLIKKQLSNHLIIRPGALFSESERSALRSIIDMKKNGMRLSANSNIITPTYTSDMANGVIGLIQHGAVGTFNLGNKGSSTTSDFFSTVFKHLKLDTEVDEFSLGSNNMIAQRPNNMSVSIRKFENETGFTFRTWEDALKDCIRKIKRSSQESSE